MLIKAEDCAASWLKAVMTENGISIE